MNYTVFFPLHIVIWYQSRSSSAFLVVDFFFVSRLASSMASHTENTAAQNSFSSTVAIDVSSATTKAQ